MNDIRPTSLLAITEHVQLGMSYVSAMKEFIDTLISYGIRPEAYADEPRLLDDPTLMAHLGGMAEYLAFLNHAPAPAWCQQPTYFLRSPTFHGGQYARALMLAKTPFAFRRRLLFCGEVLRKYKILKDAPTTRTHRPLDPRSVKGDFLKDWRSKRQAKK